MFVLQGQCLYAVSSFQPVAIQPTGQTLLRITESNIVCYHNRTLVMMEAKLPLTNQKEYRCTIDTTSSDDSKVFSPVVILTTVSKYLKYGNIKNDLRKNFQLAFDKFRRKKPLSLGCSV